MSSSLTRAFPPVTATGPPPFYTSLCPLNLLNPPPVPREKLSKLRVGRENQSECPRRREAKIFDAIFVMSSTEKPDAAGGAWCMAEEARFSGEVEVSTRRNSRDREQGVEGVCFADQN